MEESQNNTEPAPGLEPGTYGLRILEPEAKPEIATAQECSEVVLNDQAAPKGYTMGALQWMRRTKLCEVCGSRRIQTIWDERQHGALTKPAPQCLWLVCFRCERAANFARTRPAGAERMGAPRGGQEKDRGATAGHDALSSMRRRATTEGRGDTRNVLRPQRSKHEVLAYTSRPKSLDGFGLNQVVRP